MKTGTRAVLTAIIGFIGYRVCIEFMAWGVGFGIGILLGVATWLITGAIKRAE